MEENVKKKHSKLSIAALIFSFLIPISFIGIILAIIDLIKNKNNKHVLTIVALVIGIIFTIVFYSPSDNATPTKSTEDTNNTVEMSKDDFIASCKDMAENYKSIARNPDDYVGQNFSLTCYVSDARDGYYIVYPVDMKEMQSYLDDGIADNKQQAMEFSVDYDSSVWLIEARDVNADDYVKILDNDYLNVYGVFEGLQASQNALNDEIGEEMALHIKYVDIISE